MPERSPAVPLPPPETQEFTEHITLLESQTRQELEQSQQQMQEIKLLLGQTASEVEKLAQRELALANRVRDMEINLESYNRSDVRTLYNANHEVQLRLFMMRSQAEQLETRQQNIREYQDKLRTIIELLHLRADTAAPAASGEEPKRPAAGDGATIPAWRSSIAVLEGQEDERQRLAREIQDGPTQAMTNILLHLEVCKQVLKHDPDGAMRELDTLKTMLGGNLRDARRLIAYIRPLALDNLGLAEMLRRDLGEVGRERGFQTIVNDNLTTALPHHLQVTLFRLLQRAATEMMAAGQGGQLAVTLSSGPERVTAQLALEGTPSVEVQARLDAYLANQSTARRLDLLGGLAEAQAAGETTTHLTFEFPLHTQPVDQPA
jgi:two-component system, NarL family, sensor histidine kinase DegS